MPAETKILQHTPSLCCTTFPPCTRPALHAFDTRGLLAPLCLAGETLQPIAATCPTPCFEPKQAQGERKGPSLATCICSSGSELVCAEHDCYHVRSIRLCTCTTRHDTHTPWLPSLYTTSSSFQRVAVRVSLLCHCLWTANCATQGCQPWPDA